MIEDQHADETQTSGVVDDRSEHEKWDRLKKLSFDVATREVGNPLSQEEIDEYFRLRKELRGY